MKQKTAHLTVTGNNTRNVSNEILTAFYSLTKKENKGKMVSQSVAEKYFKMPPDAFTRQEIVRMLSDTASMDDKAKIHKAMYDTWDTIVIPAKFFYEEQEKLTTTIGRFLFNHYVLNGAGIIGITRYVDEVLDKKGLGKLDTLIGRLYLEDQITQDQFVQYIDRRDNLGYWLIGMICKTISLKMAKPMKEIVQMKEKLIKANAADLEKKDINAMNKIEKELVAKAKEILKDDPGMDQYKSGELNFDNNYKVNAILKGPVRNKLTNEFDFIGTSFMDGIDPNDMDIHANGILAGQYPASIGTQKAGYLGKKLLALLQMIELDEEDTDCGTKRLIPITITDVNKASLYYSNFVHNGQMIMLTDKNVSSYLGKTMMFRSPMSCISDKLCSKCAGRLFYLLGIKQAGLWSVQLSHNMLNLALKAKHDTSINLYHIDPNRIEEDL